MKLTIQSAKELIFDLTLFFNSLKILLLRLDCFAGGMYLFGVRIWCLSLSGTGVSSKLIFFLLLIIIHNTTSMFADSSNQICFSQFIVSYHFFLFCNISQFANSVFLHVLNICTFSVIFKYSRENNIFVLKNLYVKF